ncbi:MAG: D-alanyl-D-alanine carboxypeptidase/D-alanyl-D-alanine-endopeptidase [Sedimentisphaerales bacterium]|nr:D-alanyl-D-alanine carboxypeptidase/D-alanyl-D-alanine-endopeptidase [Sedimentisphaerales bacterium]
MKRIVKFVLIELFLISTLSGVCLGGITERINSIISAKSQKKVDFAVKIIEAKTGKTIYSHNGNKPMIPASNMKLVISAAAIKYLGSDYQFTTKIGLLDDTLVVIGGGDPLLGDSQTDSKYDRNKDWVFEEIINSLKSEGVTGIKDIIVDSSFFDDNRVHPDWPKEQVNQEYACEVSGLNYNGNCIRITTTNINNKVAISIDPETKYLSMINEVKAVSMGSSAVGSYRHKTPNKITVYGKCHKSAGFDVAIERPAAMFGFILAERLRLADIEVRGELLERYVKKDTKIKIIKTFTTKMPDVLSRCNKDSMALSAESLLKTLSAENTTGEINGEWSHGLTLVSRFLKGSGVDNDQFVLSDARGLSRKNMLSPNAITMVLFNMYSSDSRGVFFDSFAVGGVDGTLKKYFYQKKHKGNVIGKTGYINNVKSLSGMCKTPKGDYLFSILTNGANGKTRTAINDIAKAIIDYQ